MDSHAAISEILDYYANRSDKSDQTVIISLLRELQQANGCIPVSLQERAANAAGVPVSIIRTLMKFHSDLKSSDYRHDIYDVAVSESLYSTQDSADADANRPRTVSSHTLD